MFKFFFDSFMVKAFFLLSGILMLLIFIGHTIEDEPIKIEPWVKRSSLENKSRQQRRPTYNYSKKQPWSDERKEQTENWADFLEELENRGYTIYDPEAEDIWEEFY